MSAPMHVEDWVELFRGIGLDETQMHQWHALFERKHPHAHQSFLEWLNIAPDEVAEIRRKSSTEW